MEKLRTSLQSDDLPILAERAECLGKKVHAILCNVAREQCSEEELESFIGSKLQATSANIEQLETQEYPDIASEKHGVLHTAFVAYEDALLNLDHFLWGESDSEASLGDILRLFQAGDYCLSRFLNELEEDLAPLTSFNALW